MCKAAARGSLLAAIAVTTFAATVSARPAAPTTRVWLAVGLESGATLTGSGQIDGPGVNCARRCTLDLRDGRPAVFRAVGGRGYAFDHWEDVSPCAESDPTSPVCTIVPDGTPVRLQAQFRPNTFTLQVVPDGSARISSGNGIDCGAGTEARIGDTCSAAYVPGSVVDLRVTPASGTRFVGWGTESCPDRPECRVVVQGDQTVTALIDPLHLTVVATGADGSVTSDPPGIDCAAPCQTQTATFGRNVHVTLNAGTGFRRWGPPCGGLSPRCTFTLFADETVVAAFGNVAPPSFAPVPSDTPADKTFTLRATGPGRLFARGPKGQWHWLACRSNCVKDVSITASLFLTPVPNHGAHLVRWTFGRVSSMSVPVSTFDGASARFARNKHGHHG